MDDKMRASPIRHAPAGGAHIPLFGWCNSRSSTATEMRIPAARSQRDISLPDWGTGVISPKAVWGQPCELNVRRAVIVNHHESRVNSHYDVWQARRTG